MMKKRKLRKKRISGKSPIIKKAIKKNSYILSLLVIACNSNALFNEVDKIDQGSWHANQVIQYNVPVQDTANGYDIQLHLRNTSDYAYRNLWLFIETQAPNGNILCDTVEFFLADQSGKWLGKGLGNVNTMLPVYKKNIRFPVSGIYQFKIQQAMRTQELHGIIDVGLFIDKTK